MKKLLIALTRKMTSRRFAAWVIWTILVFYHIHMTQTVNVVLIGWYGGITCVYIGSSVAKSLIFRDKVDEQC